MCIQGRVKKHTHNTREGHNERIQRNNKNGGKREIKVRNTQVMALRIRCYWTR